MQACSTCNAKPCERHAKRSQNGAFLCLPFGIEKSSFRASNFEGKSTPKSTKMEVRKGTEKRSRSEDVFFRFSTDFGGPGRPRGLPNDQKSASWSLLGRPRGLPGRVPDASEPHFRFATTSGPQNGRLGTPKLTILPPPRRRFGRFSASPGGFFRRPRRVRKPWPREPHSALSTPAPRNFALVIRATRSKSIDR